jgi:hypothetical protein
VLLAQPALATRPGVLAERAGILSFANQAGLEAAQVHPAALACTSPPFEAPPCTRPAFFRWSRSRGGAAT